MEIREVKIKQVKEILKKEGIPFWLFFHSDPVTDYLTGWQLQWGALLFTPEKSTALISSLESNNIKYFDEKIVSSKYDKGLLEHVIDKLCEVGYGKEENIALNYSQNYPWDFLGAGRLLNLKKVFTKKFGAAKNRFISAELLLPNIMNQLLPEELENTRRAAEYADEIILNALMHITPGMTEEDVAIYMHRLTEEKALETAWESKVCPIVLTGKRIGGSAHAIPSGKKISKGETVYIDFGVKLNGYASDLQRMAYVLKDNETKAPESIQGIFNIIIKAINSAVSVFKPGAKGYDVDNAARNVIINAGYPNYPHATGHLIGNMIHNIGVILGPTSDRRSYLMLKENNVLTIEPAIRIANGGSVEEDVLVTSSGAEFLAPRQESLYLIG